MWSVEMVIGRTLLQHRESKLQTMNAAYN